MLKVMTRNATLLMALYCAIAAQAQNDSLGMSERNHQLQEVVVKSDLARTTAEKSVYLPTRKQRNAAADATSLLQHLMIPQLNIDPLSGMVRTIANEDVAIFIDFMPVTKEDLEGMNTQDVKRVEVYDFPKDIRFQSNKHVVNFIMQKYEIGGYTKLSTTEMLMSEKDFQTSGSVYSKLVSKRWTFDANLSDTYSRYGHLGSESKAVFRLPTQEIRRNEISENGESRIHKTSASLRATYNTEKIQISNSLEILYENKPKGDLNGTVIQAPPLPSPKGDGEGLLLATSCLGEFKEVSVSRNTSSSITPKYQGIWFFSLPKNWGLTVAPGFMYMHNKINRYYREGETQPIENRIKENASHLNWQVALSRSFAEKHTVSFSNYGQNYHSAMDYVGSVISDSRINQFSMGQGVEYGFATQKLNLSVEFVYCYSYNKMNDEKQESWFPRINIGGTYSLNSKHSIGASVIIARQSTGGAQRNSNILQSNKLLYYSGNPTIDDYTMGLLSLKYTWMPSNIFTASAYVNHIFSDNYFTNIYQLFNNGTALLRTMENVGDMSRTNIGASMTLRMLNNSLQLSAYPSLDIYKSSGTYSNSKSVFNLVATATWYINQFYLQTYFRDKERKFTEADNSWKNTRPYFSLTAGWGNATWKARIDIANPFRGDWLTARTEIITPLYSVDTKSYGTTSHLRINLTLTYIFNYGKKVKQGNELKAATGGQSSIL